MPARIKSEESNRRKLLWLHCEENYETRVMCSTGGTESDESVLHQKKEALLPFFHSVNFFHEDEGNENFRKFVLRRCSTRCEACISLF